ncbi:MAG: S49 family peptidase [Xanthomonadaceae bacterium]|nr:S49 family peptidase [Xanthomonadaceae bacterium]MBH2008129.1 S49 family peptidase [Xanthomonadaceae bacterium]
MKLLDLLTSAWAILPDQLGEMQAIYATHLRGDKIDIDAIEARLGRPLASEQQDYQIRQGGVAVLTLDGVMAPKANMFMRISGGVSTQIAGLQVESAMADPRVTALVLAIDSPGGSVFGTPELGTTVRELSSIKPIVTVSEATLASAAYWVGSAANGVYISGPTVTVGSIGVVASHNYNPQAGGGTTTEVTAGKYKRMASPTGPLTKEGKAYMQGQVDHLYSVFVDAVAANRGASIDAVLEQMADGRVFIGQQAIDRGLVDGYSTVDAMVEQLATDPAKFAKRRKAVFALGGLPVPAKPAGAQADATPTEPVLLDNSIPKTEKESPMDRKELELQHPALFAQLKNEFTAEATAAATATATAAGAAAERQRIADVRAQSLNGHEALIETLAADGKTTGPEAAMAVLAVERTRAAGAAVAHFADAPAAASHAAAPSDAKKTPAVQAAEATVLARSKGISVVAALKELGFA